MTKKRLPQVKLTKQLKEFIVDKVTEGYDVATIHRMFPGQICDPKYIYRAQVKDPEFGAAMTDAYTIMLQRRLDELHMFAGMTARQYCEHMNIDPDTDWRQIEAVLKRRMDELKFVLAKMGPVLTERFKSKQHVSIDGPSPVQIAVQNFYTLEAPQRVISEG